jgi:16S rRNA (cytosine1402-N4)-methyltransferase
MTAGRGIQGGLAAGGPARHVPVLVEEAIGFLAPDAGGVFIDATLGGGGYTAALLERGASVIAIDRDPVAIGAGLELARTSGGRLSVIEGRFADLDRTARALGRDRVDGIVLDIGVSSMQLDDPARGFSFRDDGPLDMRMGRDGPTAADVVNQMERGALAQLIAVLGEEKRPRAVAAAIDRARLHKPITRTAQLAEIVAGAVGHGGRGLIHPATRTFQAIRIFVNRELDELGRALAASERILADGGRLVVVAFHSLEDRIVKRFLADRSAKRASGSRHRPEAVFFEPTFELLARGAVSPTDAELARNPRARSARLRAARRTDAPARPVDMTLIGVPRLPERMLEMS